MNSRQERRARRATVRLIGRLSKIIEEQIGPMIKEENREDFREITEGLKETMIEAWKPRRQEEPWFHHDKED